MTKSHPKNAGERIKARRETFGYTQEEFSELLNLTCCAYVKIENNSESPSLEILIEISKHLNLSLDYMVFGTEEQKLVDATEQEKILSLTKKLGKENLRCTREIIELLIKMKDI